MYLPNHTNELGQSTFLAAPDLIPRADEIDIEFLDSPELIDLMAQREMSLQGLNLGDLDALGLSFKSIKRKISRGVKRIGRQAKKLGKKYVRTAIRIGTLGLSDFQRAVTRTKKQLRNAQARLAAAKTPAERLRWQTEVDRLTLKLKKKRKRRTRVIKGAVIVGAAVLTAGVGGAALFKGALALGKSGALAKIVPLLMRGGMAKDKAELAAQTMIEFPPDPSLMDPQAMIADSFQRRDNAREQPAITKALPWLGAGAAALLAFMV